MIYYSLSNARDFLELAQFIVFTSAKFRDWLSRMIRPIMELRTCKNFLNCANSRKPFALDRFGLYSNLNNF